MMRDRRNTNEGNFEWSCGSRGCVSCPGFITMRTKVSICYLCTTSKIDLVKRNDVVVVKTIPFRQATEQSQRNSVSAITASSRFELKTTTEERPGFNSCSPKTQILGSFGGCDWEFLRMRNTKGTLMLVSTAPWPWSSQDYWTGASCLKCFNGGALTNLV